MLAYCMRGNKTGSYLRTLIKIRRYGSPETLSHIFFKCPKARAIWWGFLNVRSEWDDMESFQSWITRTLPSLAKENQVSIVEQIILLLHYLWFQRNQLVHKGFNTSAVADIQTLQYLHHFHALSTSSFMGSSSRAITPCHSSSSQSLIRDTDWILSIYKERRNANYVYFRHWNQDTHCMLMIGDLGTTDFLIRCLRAALLWICSGPYFARQTILIISDKPHKLKALHSESSGTVSRDVNQLLQLFGSHEFLSSKEVKEVRMHPHQVSYYMASSYHIT